MAWCDLRENDDDEADDDDDGDSGLEIVLASSNSTIPLVVPFPCKSTIVFVTLTSSSLLLTVFECCMKP